MKNNPLLSEVLQLVRNWAAQMLQVDAATISADTRLIADLDLDPLFQKLLYFELSNQYAVEFADDYDDLTNQERTVRNLAEMLINAGALPGSGSLREQGNN